MDAPATFPAITVIKPQPQGAFRRVKYLTHPLSRSGDVVKSFTKKGCVRRVVLQRLNIGKDLQILLPSVLRGKIQFNVSSVLPCIE